MKDSQGWFNTEFSVSPLAPPGGGLSGLRPQAAFGVLALRVPIPDTLRGVGYAHPRRAALGAPFGEGEPRSGTPMRPCRCGLRPRFSVLAFGQHGALAARQLGGRVAGPPCSPCFLSCRHSGDFASGRPACKGPLRQVLTRSLRCAPGCGFRSCPCRLAGPSLQLTGRRTKEARRRNHRGRHMPTEPDFTKGSESWNPVNLQTTARRNDD